MKRIYRTIVIGIIIVCLALCAGCTAADTGSKSTASASQTTAKATTAKAKKKAAEKKKTTAASPQKQAKESFSLNNYDHLSARKQEVYDRLLEGFEAGDTYVPETLEEFEDRIVDSVFFYNLLADHPEYYYLRGHSNLYEQSTTGVRTARFDMEYIYDAQEHEARQEKMQAELLSIKKSLPPKADDFAKAKAAYDYLIKNCEYDYSYTGNSLQENETTASYADGAMLDHKAVCSGYSRAFKWIMEAFEIPCMCVSNSEHEWNIVWLEGNYYHIDVTWADTDDNPGTRYFCVTDGEIYKDHAKPGIAVPECVVVHDED
ncbi:MAG: hypothetical protein IJJ41_08215 [Clostridia bacterium]|nr:hypothetical protein [Clostridia bacterium]